MSDLSWQTAEELETPAVRQISVFLEDRVGALHRLLQSFEGTEIKILALSIVHAIDCAIVRLIVDDTDQATDILRRRDIPISVTEMVVVELPAGHGLRSICSALLTAEISIDYVYALIVWPTGRPAIAIHTDNLDTAAQVLKGRKCRLMSENDLGPGGVR